LIGVIYSSILPEGKKIIF